MAEWRFWPLLKVSAFVFGIDTPQPSFHGETKKMGWTCLVEGFAKQRAVMAAGCLVDRGGLLLTLTRLSLYRPLRGVVVSSGSCLR